MRETRRANARVWSSLTIFSLPRYRSLSVSLNAQRERKRERERERGSFWQKSAYRVTGRECIRRYNSTNVRLTQRSIEITKRRWWISMKFNRSIRNDETPRRNYVPWYSSMERRFGLSERDLYDRDSEEWSFVFFEIEVSNSSLFRAIQVVFQNSKGWGTRIWLLRHAGNKWGEENFRVNWSIRLTECERVKFRGNILTQKVKGARISKGAV